MIWLKKNLVLVVGGVVALGLLGYAGFFLYSNITRVAEITGELAAKTEELKTLQTRDPHPNQGNIDAAKREQTKLGDFVGQARRFFVPVASFASLDSAAFKGLLETTIADLERDAQRGGVTLPSRFNFTFSAQRTRVDFAKETLVPLAMQVAEIDAICNVLFRARIHSLVSLRRVPVAKEDEGAADYLVGRKAITNAVTGAVLSPYELTFQGFSAELAGVLDGFYRSTNAFIVKNIDVQTNVVMSAGTEMTTSTYFNSYAPPGATAPQPPVLTPEQMMRQRYGVGSGGLGDRYRSRPESIPVAPTVPAPGVVPSVRRGPETVLDERPLKVTMYVEAVRLAEPAPESPKAASPK